MVQFSCVVVRVKDNSGVVMDLELGRGHGRRTLLEINITILMRIVSIFLCGTYMKKHRLCVK